MVEVGGGGVATIMVGRRQWKLWWQRWWQQWWDGGGEGGGGGGCNSADGGSVNAESGGSDSGNGGGRVTIAVVALIWRYQWLWQQQW